MHTRGVAHDLRSGKLWFRVTTEHHALSGAAWVRPRYPDSLIRRVATLARKGRILDVQAGTGELARALAAHRLSVTALEASSVAIARGKAKPLGDKVEWREGTWESGPLAASGPGGRRYDLVVVGDQAGSFPFDAALPRLRSVVGGWFAMAGRGDQLDGGLSDLFKVLVEWAGDRAHRMRDEVSLVTRAPRFRRVGHWRARPQTVLQPVPVYVRSLNRRYALGLEGSTPERQEAFYRSVEACLDRNNHGGMVRLVTSPWVVWGRISGG